MENINQILDNASRLAKNYSKHFNKSISERQKIESVFKDAYVRGYSRAIIDFKKQLYKEELTPKTIQL